MTRHTVFMTNRALKRVNRNGRPVFTEGIGKVIRAAVATPANIKVRHRRRRATRRLPPVDRMKKTYDLRLVAEGDEAATLAEIVAKPNGKPWIFFLHGNNQTTEKYLQKSRIIQELYDANMILFAWPSRSYNDNLQLFLLSGAAVSLMTPAAALGKLLVTRALARKIKQYKVARQIAKRTAPDFVSAFELVRDHLLLPLRQDYDPHTCLLVHSLGHKVLRHAVEDEGISGYEFTKAMLHQADEENAAHPDWVSRMQIVADANTHITRNKKDAMLFLSGALNNNVDLDKALTRMGNRRQADAPNGPFHYPDFTAMNNVGRGHEVAWDTDISNEVEAVVRPILVGAQTVHLAAKEGIS